MVLQRRDGVKPEMSHTVKIVRGVAETAFDLPEQSGPYKISAMVGSARYETEFIMPEIAAWRGNTLGMARNVPEPFTPLQRKDSVFRCWEREYDFRDAVFPQSIRALGRELLSRPVGLEAMLEGAPVAWRNKPVSVQKSDGYGAEFTGVLEGRSKSGKTVSLHLSGELRYDGFLDCTVSGDDAAQFSSLTLRLPLNASAATYFHHYGNLSFGSSGTLPPGKGTLVKTHFIPFFWLGNDDCGLFYCSDSDRYTPNGDAPDFLECVRLPDGNVELRVHLLAEGQKLLSGWQHRFALQATPVKPRPKSNGRDLRHFNVGGNRLSGKKKGRFWYTVWTNPAFHRYFGYPEQIPGSSFGLARFHKYDVLFMNYQILSCMLSTTPEFRFFRDQWKMGYIDSMSSDVVRAGGVLAAVPYSDSNYSDFITWKLCDYIRKTPFEGIYNDNAFPYDSYNLKTGIGYCRPGEQTPRCGYSIFGGRELYRRVLAAARGVRPGLYAQCHVSNKMTIPLIEHHNSFLSGENIHIYLKDSYPEILALDVFRIEYTGRAWGITPFFLPMFKGAAAKQPEPTRELMGMLMIHDVNIAPSDNTCNLAEITKALDLLDDFGYVDSEFVPYFSSRAVAKTSGMPGVYASAYRKEDGSILIVAANLTRTDRSGELILQSENLPPKQFRIVTHPGKKAVPVTDRRIPLRVPARDYRMFILSENTGKLLW